MEFDWFRASLLFVVYLATDYLFAYYTKRVVEGKAYLAAHAGTIIVFLAAFGVISYTENPWYILPIAMGSWVGTFLSVKYS